MNGKGIVDAARQKWQFSLRALLIASTLFAVLLAPGAYFGWRGVAVSGVVATYVAAFVLLGRRPNLLEVLCLLTVLGMVVAIVAPAIVSIHVARSTSSSDYCRNNLRQLALAMQMYHQQHGSFPPAYIADDNGQPVHSWRVLLLPYLEEDLLYRRYRWDEPWNGPNNAQLEKPLDIYECWGDQTTGGAAMTNYVVVTGPGTAFPGDKSTKLADFRDGISKTLLIVEVANSGIHWMEPRDLTIDQLAQGVNPATGQGISSFHHGDGALVVCADGRAVFLSDKTTPEQLRALLTIDGGEPINVAGFD